MHRDIFFILSWVIAAIFVSIVSPVGLSFWIKLMLGFCLGWVLNLIYDFLTSY